MKKTNKPSKPPVADPRDPSPITRNEPSGVRGPYTGHPKTGQGPHEVEPGSRKGRPAWMP